MNIFYSRISKGEENTTEKKQFNTKKEYLQYKWKQQEEAVKKKFNVNFDYSFYDSGSAYDLEKMSKRTEFFKLIKIITNNQQPTIQSFFKKQIKPNKDIKLYIFDYNRISRRIEFNLLFSIICDMYGVNIYSCNQDQVIQPEKPNTMDKALKYMMLLFTAISGEQYSESISKNTKKSIQNKKGVAMSYNNKIWGKGFRNNKTGKKLEYKKQNEMITHIDNMILDFENKNASNYFSHIILYVLDNYNVTINKSYLSKRKKNLEKTSVINEYFN